jgi:hypothetical protein
MICMRPDYNPDEETRLATMDVHQLQGHLYVPAGAGGLAVIAQSRPGRGTRSVERAIEGRLRQGRLGTCRISLLDGEESEDSELHEDVELLADRFVAVLEYLARQPETAHLPIALVGSEASGAAALVTAARHVEVVRAVVSLGGNPDIATATLSRIAAPTILVVPGKSRSLVKSNQRAFWSLRCTSQLAVIRGAGAQFVEPGTLLACREVICQWCVRHLAEAADWGPRSEDLICRRQTV